ncbi:MAG: hypothetical protein M3144_07055 [Actinomycetota bacterium]|nr:hypothetical protein [Actinomycetota bacterium]
MKSPPRRAELRVSQIEDDGWTWCYVDPAHDIELFSNETYESSETAAEWARRAYPEVPFADAEAEHDDGEEGEEEEG